MLLMAAKAVGLELVLWNSDGTPHAAQPGDTVSFRWNPLEDDGDALRLAVKLEIQCSYSAFTGCAFVRWSRGDRVDSLYGPEDPCATVRLAIVRAAAAIGEQSNG